MFWSGKEFIESICKGEVKLGGGSGEPSVFYIQVDQSDLLLLYISSTSPTLTSRYALQCLK